MKISIQTTVYVVVGLLVVASLASLYFALSSQAAIPITLVALANSIAVILLIFLITRGVIRPLHAIKKVMEKVGQGDYTVRIKDGGTKEMEDVQETLNTMIKKVSLAQKEVQYANTALEKKVQERTLQLKELADSLEERVQERTQELQQKLHELERFQRLGVQRELRMIELKDEIQGLQDQFMHSRNQEKQHTRHDQTKKPKKRKDA